MDQIHPYISLYLYSQRILFRESHFKPVTTWMYMPVEEIPPQSNSYRKHVRQEQQRLKPLDVSKTSLVLITRNYVYFTSFSSVVKSLALHAINLEVPYNSTGQFATAPFLGPRSGQPIEFHSYFLLVLYFRLILTHCYLSVEPREKSRQEYDGSHASASGATLGDNHSGSANSSIIAIMGTKTIGTARVRAVTLGPSQPVRDITQHERDDLLRGVGSQFDSVAGHASDGGRSTAGHGHH